MPSQSPQLDRVFQALSDPTRRAVIARLSDGQASVSELAAPFDMALPSFLQHLKMLEGSGLVRSDKAGRVRTYRLAPQPLKAAEGWMAAQRKLWEARLDALDDYLGVLARASSPRARADEPRPRAATPREKKGK